MLRDAAILIVVFAAGLYVGNYYGWSADKLAKFTREIQSTNAKLQKLESEDARDAITEDEQATREDAEFAASLSRIGKCIITPIQADALNKIGGSL